MDLPTGVANFDFTVTDIHYIVERHTDPSWKLQYSESQPYHGWHTLSHTTGGMAHYDIAGQQVEVREGDVLYFPKFLPRTGASDPNDPWSHIVAQYHVHYVGDEGPSVFDNLDCVYQDIDRTRINSLFRELLQSWTSKHTGYSVRCRSRIMEILYILIVHSLERKTLHLRMIETLIGLMADDERKFYTIGELSDKAGVSPSYLCLIFKQTTGMTAIQYQNRIKIGKARDLLLSGDCNVSMAAERLGFNDIYYFSRLFKKVTGTTPSRVMKSAKG
jgi:AraC-like DNA-binding protein